MMAEGRKSYCLLVVGASAPGSHESGDPWSQINAWSGRMSRMLHVGIVGTGWAGGCHAAAFRQLPDVEVTPFGIAPAHALMRLRRSSGIHRWRCMTAGRS